MSAADDSAASWVSGVVLLRTVARILSWLICPVKYTGNHQGQALPRSNSGHGGCVLPQLSYHKCLKVNAVRR
jgi:hypothetical protein